MQEKTNYEYLLQLLKLCWEKYLENVVKKTKQDPMLN